tara:strand:+ start:190 stop:414 length:225 start_codon:yes stop_codon:yes gene_type:complete
MIRIIIILFLLTNPVLANCKYYAEADVINGEIVDKKEHYTCNEEEEDNFFVKFLTDPKYETSFITLVAILLENL